MDAFSWGMLCLWVLAEADALEDIRSLPDWTRPPGHSISFDDHIPLQKNSFESWKLDGRDLFVPLATLLVDQQPRISEGDKRRFVVFFQHTLSIVPEERSDDFDMLIDLLDPHR